MIDIYHVKNAMVVVVWNCAMNLAEERNKAQWIMGFVMRLIHYTPKGCFALIRKFLNEVAIVEDFCFYSVGS